MRQLRLYPAVIVQGQSFKDVKPVVVPDQSMSLKEILQRFVKKESLPVYNEGYYADHLGDLEKMAREDITVRHERAAEIKEKIRAAIKKREAHDAEQEASKKAGGSGEPLKGATPPVQPPTPPPPPGPFPGSHE